MKLTVESGGAIIWKESSLTANGPPADGKERTRLKSVQYGGTVVQRGAMNITLVLETENEATG